MRVVLDHGSTQSVCMDCCLPEIAALELTVDWARIHFIVPHKGGGGGGPTLSNPPAPPLG